MNTQELLEQDQIKKLPKWAQHRIKKLEADCEYYKKQLAQMNGEEKTNTFISNYTDGDKPLPNCSRIVFKTPSARFHVGIRGGNQLSVHCYAEESNHCLFIRPEMSNSISLSAKPY